MTSWSRLEHPKILQKKFPARKGGEPAGKDFPYDAGRKHKLGGKEKKKREVASYKSFKIISQNQKGIPKNRFPTPALI